jgi:diguanylate cyclase (GGDEF)-like protein
MVERVMVETIQTTPYIPPPVPAASGFQDRPSHQQPEREKRQANPDVDIASVLSLPENVMPPAIQEIFLQLVEQVERLREEVERVRSHEKFLISAADRHAFLPTLNRRSFMAGLTRMLEHAERAELPVNVGLLHVEGIEAIRGSHGLQAGDAALAFVATAVQNELQQGDLIAYLDGSDFAVALALSEPDAAAASIGRIVGTVKGAPLMWNQDRVTLDIKVGLAVFRPGIAGDKLLSEASQAMISGTSALSI